MTAAGEDTLFDARQAGRWLSTLTRDSAEACDEMAGALRKARARFGHFSIESQRAALLVDKWAAPMQSAWLEEFATGGPATQERGSRIACTLSAINQSFGQYYDTLLESLRGVARADHHPHLTCVALVRRLAQMRSEMPLSALGQGDPPRWEKIHRLYRSAMQQRIHNGHRPDAIEIEGLAAASAESEYMQILLMHQLDGAPLDAQEILRAGSWLGRWVASLHASRTRRRPRAMRSPSTRAAPKAWWSRLRSSRPDCCGSTWRHCTRESARKSATRRRGLPSTTATRSP